MARSVSATPGDMHRVCIRFGIAVTERRFQQLAKEGKVPGTQLVPRGTWHISPFDGAKYLTSMLQKTMQVSESEVFHELVQCAVKTSYRSSK